MRLTTRETPAEQRARISAQADAIQRANDERVLTRLAGTHEGRLMMFAALDRRLTGVAA